MRGFFTPRLRRGAEVKPNGESTPTDAWTFQSEGGFAALLRADDAGTRRRYHRITRLARQLARLSHMLGGPRAGRPNPSGSELACWRATGRGLRNGSYPYTPIGPTDTGLRLPAASAPSGCSLAGELRTRRVRSSRARSSEPVGQPSELTSEACYMDGPEACYTVIAPASPRCVSRYGGGRRSRPPTEPSMHQAVSTPRWV